MKIRFEVTIEYDASMSLKDLQEEERKMVAESEKGYEPAGLEATRHIVRYLAGEALCTSMKNKLPGAKQVLIGMPYYLE